MFKISTFLPDLRSLCAKARRLWGRKVEWTKQPYHLLWISLWCGIRSPSSMEHHRKGVQVGFLCCVTVAFVDGFLTIPWGLVIDEAMMKLAYVIKTLNQKIVEVALENHPTSGTWSMIGSELHTLVRKWQRHHLGVTAVLLQLMSFARLRNFHGLQRDPVQPLKKNKKLEEPGYQV